MPRLYLRRRQSRVMAVSAIVIFFALGVVFLKVNQTTPAPPKLSNQASTNPDSSSSSLIDGSPSSQADNSSGFTLNNFERSETRDGKKVWEVKAKQGHYMPQQNQAIVEDAILWMYRTENQTIRLETKHAKLILDGQKLVKAEAYDGVKIIQNDEVTLETERATYDQIQGSLIAPGHVTITSTLYTVVGDGLEGNTDSRDFRLLKNVQTSIYPQKKNHEKKKHN